MTGTSHLVIGRAGSVQIDPRRSTLDDLGLRSCVRRVFRAMRFPRQPAPTWATYPLIFS